MTLPLRPTVVVPASAEQLNGCFAAASPSSLSSLVSPNDDRALATYVSYIDAPDGSYGAGLGHGQERLKQAIRRCLGVSENTLATAASSASPLLSFSTVPGLSAGLVGARAYASMLRCSCAPDSPMALLASGCALGSVGMAALVRAMKALPPRIALRITVLDLGDDALTDVGASPGALADALLALARALPCLAMLSLRGTLLGGKGGEALCACLRACRNMRYVDVGRCALGPKGAAALLAAFAAPAPVLAVAAAALVESSAVMEPAAAVAMAAADTTSTAAMAAEALAEIGLVGSSGTTGARAQGLGGFSGDIRWQAAAAERAAAAALSPAEHCPPPFACNRWLTLLDLGDNALVGAAGDGAAAGADATALVAALLAHPTLQHLSLARNRLGGVAGAAVLAALTAGLPANKRLRSLNLDGNGISGPAIERLLAALCVHPALQSLSLSGNGAGSSAAAALAALWMCDSLVAGPALHAEVRSSCGGGGGGGALVPVGQGPLRVVDLRTNHVGALGVAALLAAAGVPAFARAAALSGEHTPQPVSSSDAAHRSRPATPTPPHAAHVPAVSAASVVSASQPGSARPGTPAAGDGGAFTGAGADGYATVGLGSVLPGSSTRALQTLHRLIARAHALKHASGIAGAANPAAATPWGRGTGAGAAAAALSPGYDRNAASPTSQSPQPSPLPARLSLDCSVTAEGDVISCFSYEASAPLHDGDVLDDDSADETAPSEGSQRRRASTAGFAFATAAVDAAAEDVALMAATGLALPEAGCAAGCWSGSRPAAMAGFAGRASTPVSGASHRVRTWTRTRVVRLDASVVAAAMADAAAEAAADAADDQGGASA